jgi:hypothetical protein
LLAIGILYTKIGEMEKQDLVAISDVKVSLRDHPQGHRGQTDDPCSDGYFGQDSQ